MEEKKWFRLRERDEEERKGVKKKRRIKGEERPG